MALCYYKEVFASGLIVALMILAVLTLFGDVIREWRRKFIKFLGVN
ncbi:hypothetical protein KAI04_03020 [Candidatus Pacearchaeota archaeon]|nr:hypothetical protein [Candidatus Pacearchaeota archaeon]